MAGSAEVRAESTAELKESVRRHWSQETCGTRGIAHGDRAEFFKQIEEERYRAEPYIRRFAKFEEGRGKRVLEIGVGAGTDFVNWVRNGAIATGVDLTQEGIALARERLALEGLTAELRIGDAEALPFPDSSFDIVYSYGVLHHSPDTHRAIEEVYRVLAPGGVARIMVYHVPSVTGFLLWGIHCLGRGRPFHSARWAIRQFLESPGTKAYTLSEARLLTQRFQRVELSTELGSGDLLLMRPSARYQSLGAKLVWTLYPRALIRRFGRRFGLALLIEALK